MGKDLLKLNRENYLEIGKARIVLLETIRLLNYLLENRVINHNRVVGDFKEHMEDISTLLNKVLIGENEEFSIHCNNIRENFNEISEEELEEFREESTHINNKKISRKYRKLLKDDLALLFDSLRKIFLEDLALFYNTKIYPIEELEDIYKYI